ncbi:MAG: hypothetical protein ACYCYN_09425, partial [Solirubrobacteraceae bacterium]
MSAAASIDSEASQRLALDAALAEVAALAAELDAHPRFPSESLRALRDAGVPQLAADRERATLELEIGLVRAVAAADASSARILDGHFNGVERLALLAPESLRRRELRGVLAGELLLGVWGADPTLGEGEPARVVGRSHDALSIVGVKTFCSGAGGVQRALVAARDESGARVLAYVDTGEGVRIDRGWYRASGLKASESHRVLFEGARVLALLGGEDELTREPYFSGDAVRTAATWAGLADRIFVETLAQTAGVTLDDVRLRRIGEMRLALSTIGRWLEHAGALLGAEKRRLARFAGGGAGKRLDGAAGEGGAVAERLDGAAGEGGAVAERPGAGPG